MIGHRSLRKTVLLYPSIRPGPVAPTPRTSESGCEIHKAISIATHYNYVKLRFSLTG